MGRKMARMLWAAVCALALITISGAGAATLPNPVREVTAEELQEETGFAFALPEAEEVVYSIIKAQGEEDISQVQFTLDGARYCCRMQRSDELKDISGMHYEWTTQESVDLSYARAEARYNEGEAGILLWHSGLTRSVCSVSMDTGATLAALVAVAAPIDAGQGPIDDDEGMGMSYDIEEETVLTVRLEANPTTGYGWTFEISNETVLACEGEEYVPDENTEGLVGTGGTYIASFSPTLDGAGPVDLTFRYAREEETEPPKETYVFHVWIYEAGTLSVEGIE